MPKTSKAVQPVVGRDALLALLGAHPFHAYFEYVDPLAVNDLLATQISLLNGPSSADLVPGDEHAHEGAASALLQNKERPAVLAGRRARRHAVVTADLAAERQAHLVLGQAYVRSGEPEVAAHHSPDLCTPCL